MLTVAICMLGSLGWGLALLSRYDAKNARAEASEAYALVRVADAMVSAARAAESLDAGRRVELESSLCEAGAEAASMRHALGMAEADLAAIGRLNVIVDGSKELYDSTVRRMQLYGKVSPGINRGDD